MDKRLKCTVGRYHLGIILAPTVFSIGCHQITEKEKANDGQQGINYRMYNYLKKATELNNYIVIYV